MDKPSVVIVGGGVMGIASAYSLARAGAKVRLIERGSFFNSHGSSGGLSRMWRVIYSEEYLATLALNTDPMWKSIEIASKRSLIDRTGIVWFGQPTTSTTEGEIESAMRTMDRLGQKYQRLERDDIQKKYGFDNLPKDYIGVFHDNAGTIHARETQEVLLGLAVYHGVECIEQTTVTDITSTAQGIVVTTVPTGSDKKRDQQRRIECDKTVICPGVLRKNSV